MEMTLDESILYMELYKRKLFNSVSDLDKDIEAYDTAIETMKKYQKIKEVMDDYFHNDRALKSAVIKDIERIIENGNDK